MDKFLTVKKQGNNRVLFKRSVLDETIITVGSNPGATLELNDAAVAPEQFVIITEQEQMLLMNRADGTVINGETLGPGSRFELRDGDRIEIGDFQLFFTSDETNGAAEVSVEPSAGTVPPAASVPADTVVRKDFSEVLNNLKEEDSFYFQIIGAENVIERVIFDTEEIWLGLNEAEAAVKKEKMELEEVFARVKKDWSGAVIYPEESETVILNGETIGEPARLKNDDELVLADEFADEAEFQTRITFHEPVVLMALNSILPEDLPEPVTLDAAPDGDFNPGFEPDAAADPEAFVVSGKNVRRIEKRMLLGYFTIPEIIIMAIGTLVTAAIIFLVLEFV
jgi:pSer/pThr/pTyr-binding forkhead associated (FHA) protein